MVAVSKSGRIPWERQQPLRRQLSLHVGLYRDRRQQPHPLPFVVQRGLPVLMPGIAHGSELLRRQPAEVIILQVDYPCNKVTYYTQGKCENCPFLQKCIDKAQPSPKGYTKDKEYGGRLLISNCADKSELEDNMRAARAILDAFPDTEIKIRQHVIEHGKKNPEYVINGSIADRKGIEGLNGRR